MLKKRASPHAHAHGHSSSGPLSRENNKLRRALAEALGEAEQLRALTRVGARDLLRLTKENEAIRKGHQLEEQQDDFVIYHL